MSQTLDPTLVVSPLGAPKERLARDEVVVIAVLALGAFVMVLSELVMGVALPQVMDDLAVSAAVGQWLTTAYALTMAVVIPATGFLMQRFAMRPLFIVTMALFALGTAIAAVAPTFEVLLVGRVTQAVGTAILLPLLTTTAFRLAPQGRRGQMMAVTTAVPAVAGAISPAVSGIVVAQLNWRWNFLLVLPLAVLALVIGGWKMRNITTPAPVRIDLASLVLAAIGFGAVLYGLSTVAEAHGGPARTVALSALLVGVLGIGAFVLRQQRLQRRDAALLDMRVFKHRNFSLSTCIFLLLVMTAFGVNVVLPLLLQEALGLGAFETGLLLIPGGAAIAITAAAVGRFYEQAGPRTLITFGAVLATAAWWVLSTATTDTPIAAILALHLLISIGMAFMWTPLFTLAMGSLPESLYTHGSAVLNTLQQLGGAAGIAVLIAVLTLFSDPQAAGSADAVSLEGMRATCIAAGVLTLAGAAAALFLPRRAVVTGARGEA
ncbi:DHA2 family efflux MFS transporter permease subunit [Cellulomonas sp. NS3]|uniref:DHA2 family efflux MFS transporter permease subunit n=1 Tax=Cellulomonas sp. NS3 TaxID=2973977 RepID=UPI0021618696|nr:DHA2 family efflux MFS transporter permease subunit [Cellulomonas sp. NS3]